MNSQKKLIRRVLLNFDLFIAGINLVILIGITFIGVVFRYLLGNPISWVEEVQTSSIIWIVFGAAGAAFRSGNHVSVEILVDLLPAKFQRVIAIVIDIAFVVIISFFFWQSIKYVSFFFESGRVSNILKISLKYVYMIVPLSCLLMIVNYLVVRIGSKRQTNTTESNSYD